MEVIDVQIGSVNFDVFKDLGFVKEIWYKNDHRGVPKSISGCQVVNDGKLCIPNNVVQDWRGHPLCGKVFQKFLDGFLEHYTVIEPQANSNATAVVGPREDQTKRNAEGGPGGTPKKARVTLDAAGVVPLESVDKALLSECKVTAGQKDSLWLQVRANDNIVLANKGNKDWSGNEIPVCGFGKGSFKIIKADAELPDGAVELDLGGSKDLVCFNGAVQPVGDVLKELRKKNPDTKITYFKLVFDAEDPHKFTLHKTHRVIFTPRPEEKTGEMKELNAACREKMKLWEDSTTCMVMWHLKFSPVKGLIPLKPAIFLKGACTIPVGHALFLSKPGS